MRCTQAAPHSDVITTASTAIMVPADPAKAAAAGTTQNPLLGLTAHDSSAASPLLRVRRVATVAPRRTQRPAARAIGPSSSPAEVRRQAAASDSVAEVRRIWVRSTTGQARWTRGPDTDVPHPTSPPATKHRRLSTAMIVAAGHGPPTRLPRGTR